jgi:hypothetical protein
MWCHLKFWNLSRSAKKLAHQQKDLGLKLDTIYTQQSIQLFLLGEIYANHANLLNSSSTKIRWHNSRKTNTQIAIFHGQLQI